MEEKIFMGPVWEYTLCNYTPSELISGMNEMGKKCWEAMEIRWNMPQIAVVFKRALEVPMDEDADSDSDPE